MRRKITVDLLRDNRQWLIWKGWVSPGKILTCCAPNCHVVTSSRVIDVRDKRSAFNGPLCKNCAVKANLA